MVIVGGEPGVIEVFEMVSHLYLSDFKLLPQNPHIPPSRVDFPRTFPKHRVHRLPSHDRVVILTRVISPWTHYRFLLMAAESSPRLA